MTADQIRQHYPNPIHVTMGTPPGDDEYCVGGAFCLTVPGDPIAFPVWEALASRLCEKSLYKISCHEHGDLAKAIIDVNDVGNYDQAWRYLQDALDLQAQEIQEGTLL